MAIEEVSFYNIVGEEVNLSNLVNQMVDYYQQKLDVGETAVTDFNEGSEIRNLLEAFAVGIYALIEDETEVAKLPFISTSYGTWLDMIGENPFINLPRVQGDYGMGTVTFTLGSVQTSDVVIPANTILVDSVTGLEFATTGDCTVLVGETSANATVSCLTTGADGNSSAGDITIISDINTGLDTELISVSNAEAFSGGTDYEDDDDYRERLLANVQSDGFGTIGYYTALGNGVDGVHDVLLVDDASYTKKVLVNGDTKPTPDSVLLNVLTEFSDTAKIVVGHNFTVDRPTYTTVNLDISLDVATTIDENELSDALVKFFDGGSSSYYPVESDGLFINESVSNLRLSEVFYGFADVSGVTIESGGSEVTTLTPASNGVLKLGTVTFVQNEI